MPVWRFQVLPISPEVDPVGRRLIQVLRDFGIGTPKAVRASRLFFVELPGSTEAQVRAISERLLTDPVVETCRVHRQGDVPPDEAGCLGVEVHFLPGVMDNVAQSTQVALADMGIEASSVRTAARYDLAPPPTPEERARIPRVVGNACIQEVVIGTKPIGPPPTPPSYGFQLRRIGLLDLDRTGLERLSRDGHLFLSVDEMRAIQTHFRSLGREPTDLELETLAQTWSEHCVHKTLKAAIEYRGQGMGEGSGSGETSLVFENLLKETIARATSELIAEGRGPECLSVFVDNAGIVGFDDQFGVAFKVETHNHPSAIEPYGGASTGVGGVIRDILGCGLGAKPIANTDVFCVAPPDWPVDRVPKGIIHPKTVLKGVVEGVRDYGNRMGIPTVNGAVHFDPRYLGNPLVYCGCVGLIPRDRIEKKTRPGDAIVLMGGRTGRDGIHGATFSSAELSETHEDEFSHAVQIGNAIEEKKVMDVVLQARNWHPRLTERRHSSPDVGAGETRCLFSSITDCGAGGLSSAVGEMAAGCGAEVELSRVPLKYAGLRYDEIWISEAQERMVLSVPQQDVDALLALARGEDVEATVIGRFTDSGRLVVMYEGQEVGDLSLAFLHDGLPKRRRTARWSGGHRLLAGATRASATGGTGGDIIAALKRRLADPNTASKHWLVRQYDHEVQAGSVVKPLAGRGEGPMDAAVLRPRLDSPGGIALGCGISLKWADVDPYWGAVAAIDEAIRNVVCVGGDPGRTAILDNFCWPASDDEHALGALVRACQACYDAAKAYGTPFISGKDSLNNVFAMSEADRRLVRDVVEARYPLAAGLLAEQEDRVGAKLAIPYTLLISALAMVSDVRRCVRAVPVAAEGQGKIYYVGTAGDSWSGLDLRQLAAMHGIVAGLIGEGRVAAAHDVSDGGVAVAMAELATAGDVSIDLRLAGEGGLASPFFEPASGYLLQARDSWIDGARFAGSGLAIAEIGSVSGTVPALFRVLDGAGQIVSEAAVADLRAAWRRTLDW